MLPRYANERFLYRLSISPYANKFILKGGSLFIVWQNGNAYRHTMDADLLCYGQSDEDYLKAVFSEICKMEGPDNDGVSFDSESVCAQSIRIDNAYGGVCIMLQAFLGNARQHLQFDIGIGDVVTPPPESMVFPVLLDGISPVLRTYPKETVIAEKFHAMVIHGEQNSRMKDFADLFILSHEFPFRFDTLRTAMLKTFERRRTPLLNAPPFLFLRFVRFIFIKTNTMESFFAKGFIGFPSIGFF